MKMEMSGQMRLEQRMKLAPHMIASMEILQLPILALQERIEQEINSNPVLEVDEPSAPEQAQDPGEPGAKEGQTQEQSTDADSRTSDDFGSTDNLGDGYQDYFEQETGSGRRASDEEDSKLEAIKNTAAPGLSLHDYLMEQWSLVDEADAVRKAGEALIDYIDDRGYLTVRLEQLQNKDKADFTLEDLKKALKLVHDLEPAGVGARDLKECLLIQMAQSDKDMSFEARLVSEHLDAILENRLPEAAKKMGCTLERINQAIERFRKLDTSPGLQVGRQTNRPVTADVTVEYNEDTNDFDVQLADTRLPSLRISDYYVKMSKDQQTSDKTRTFLQDNIRSAQWVIDAIAQRKSTLLKVSRSVVKFQRDFFEKGQLYLKPLPMSQVADDVGVHLATVSRAVAGKYVQCSWGILPLRKFFSGGMEDDSGQSHSWEAIRGKLQEIIDGENKSKPLGDDEIKTRLAAQGIKDIARRTVAKYRKLLNIPPARLRKKY